MRLGIVLPWEEDRAPRDLEDEQAPVRVLGRRFCAHHRTQLDKEARRVYCRDCGNEVDAFTVLQTIVSDRERLIMQREHLREQVAGLEQRVEDLAREERNLKARARRRAR